MALSAAIIVQTTAGQQLQTPYEQSGYENHTTHAEMVEYLYQVKGLTSEMALGTYGESLQGRELLYGIFSRSSVGSPGEASATGKPVVVLSANVHGHNHYLREALLIMARDLGTPGTDLNDLLEDVIVIVAPSKNPDGLELGSRYNPLGADLNRDYMMLEQPSMAAFIGNIINYWHPHIMVDGHDGGAVQYGGAYPYNLLYQASALAGADQSITALADEAIFPYLDRNFEDAGFRAFYWAHGDEEAYYGGGAAPRMGRNYGGLANKVSILFELAAWHDADTAIESGIVAYTSILEYARDHADELMQTIEDARRETVALGNRAEGQIPVAETMEADDFRVTYQIEDPNNPDELLTVEDADFIKKPVGTAFRDRPWAYVLPPAARDAVAMLQRHNIQVERVTEDLELEAIAYTLGGVDYEDTDNGHRAALLLEVESEVPDTYEIQKGAYLIRTGQLLGRVVTHLLEPENTDNVFYWNRMTPLIPIADFHAYGQDSDGEEAPLLPLLKIMSETSIPSVTL